MKIEVEIWDMKEGKIQCVKDKNGNKYYPRNDYPENHRPQYFTQFTKWLNKTKPDRFNVDAFLQLYPRAKGNRIDSILSIYVKQGKLRQRDDIEKGMLEVIK